MMERPRQSDHNEAATKKVPCRSGHGLVRHAAKATTSAEATGMIELGQASGPSLLLRERDLLAVAAPRPVRINPLFLRVCDGFPVSNKRYVKQHASAKRKSTKRTTKATGD